MKTKFEDFSNESYRPRNFKNQEERDFYNFVNRFERALNKFLNTPNIDTKNNYGNYYNYTSVDSYFNAKPPHFPICFSISSISTPEKQILKNYLEEENIKHFISYDLTMDQAKKLLIELKNNFISKISLKYNL
jgi:hypothetical protein